MLQDEIKQIAKQVHNKVIDTRRHLHKHPELSFKEFETSAFIKNRLDEIGVSWQTMANTGLVAIIRGDQPSEQIIALRADIDGLSIQETNKVEYVSANNGIMHACGHDVHTSSLLGTAEILQAVKNKFGGTIKLIFQPGEETLPGGASLMIKEGVLENPVPAAIFGQHVSPAIEAGKIGICKGKFMASMDDIFVTVRGKGGHGAQPYQNIDPVIISAHILIALQQVVSRMANPDIPSVLSFGKVIADGTINIIPDEVYMEGTFRTIDESWRSEAHTRMKKMATGIAESVGGTCEFNIVRGYPSLINNETLTQKVRIFAEEYLGKENVIDTPIWMASEDFASYSQVISACFYLLGVANKQKEISSSLHTSTFNIDEEALELSTGLMAYLAVRQLGN